MLPLLSSIILHHHILPLSRLRKNPASALQTSWHPEYDNFFICGLLLAWTTYISNIFNVGKGPQIYKNWTRNGGENWFDAEKSGKNTHLLVIMRVRLLHKTLLIDLPNRT